MMNWWARWGHSGVPGLLMTGRECREEKMGLLIAAVELVTVVAVVYLAGVIIGRDHKPWGWFLLAGGFAMGYVFLEGHRLAWGELSSRYDFHLFSSSFLSGLWALGVLAGTTWALFAGTHAANSAREARQAKAREAKREAHSQEQARLVQDPALAVELLGDKLDMRALQALDTITERGELKPELVNLVFDRLLNFLMDSNDYWDQRERVGQILGKLYRNNMLSRAQRIRLEQSQLIVVYSDVRWDENDGKVWDPESQQYVSPPFSSGTGRFVGEERRLAGYLGLPEG
jgi:hypothetical protein